MYSLEVILFVSVILTAAAFLLSVIFTTKIEEVRERRRQEKLRKQFRLLDDAEMNEVWFRM